MNIRLCPPPTLLISGHLRSILKYYECPDCHKVMESTRFYWYRRKRTGVPKRTPRCKDCEIYRRSSSVDYHVNELYNQTKRRSRKKGIKFTLTKEWYRIKLNGSCELSGVPFDFHSKKISPSARAASVDRIVPAKGYIQSNCRLICISLNYLFSSWGEEDALGIVLPYLRQKGFSVETTPDE